MAYDILDSEALRAWLSLLRTSGSIKKVIDAKLRAEFDMSISRFDILSALERSNRNGLRAGALSRQLVVSEGNTTQVMTKLIDRGYVLRRNDVRDARVVIYSLSDEGEALFTKMAAVHKQWIREIFGHVPATDLAQLRLILEHLSDQSTTTEKNVA